MTTSIFYPIGRRKLRCQRNMLHLHLFASFIMRALMAVLKDVLFVSGIGRPSHILEKNGESYWLANEVGNNWHCKAFTSFWQYFILANYSWILMEGLYLHNLVFHALRMDATCSIAPYIVMGWGETLWFISYHNQYRSLGPFNSNFQFFIRFFLFCFHMQAYPQYSSCVGW